MSDTIDNNSEPDEKLAPYLYLQNPGVHSFEELEVFKEKFPGCKDTLIVWTFARLVHEKHGVRILGY